MASLRRASVCWDGFVIRNRGDLCAPGSHPRHLRCGGHFNGQHSAPTAVNAALWGSANGPLSKEEDAQSWASHR